MFVVSFELWGGVFRKLRSWDGWGGFDEGDGEESEIGVGIDDVEKGVECDEEIECEC